MVHALNVMKDSIISWFRVAARNVTLIIVKIAKHIINALFVMNNKITSSTMEVVNFVILMAVSTA